MKASAIWPALRSRLPGGALFMSALSCARAWRQWGAKPARPLLRAYLTQMLLGHRAVARRGICLPPVRISARLETPRPLYHMTYGDLLDDIHLHGLRTRPGYVFLTDDADMARGFFAWKDTRRPGGAAHALLTVDSARLMARGHAVLYTGIPHELITDTVPPDCVISAVII